MNEGRTGFSRKAFLVADMDFSGPLPVTRQFAIFGKNPYHEPGMGPNRTWAVLMVREGGSFAEAKAEILHDLEAGVLYFPLYATILRLMDEAPDVEMHMLKFRLPEALDGYVKSLPAPDHPFFHYQQYDMQIIGARRITLSRIGEQPLWSLDFVGTLTSVRAAKEAIRFLQKRGERLVGRLKLIERDDTDLVWRYRILTEPVQSEVAVA